MTLSAQRKIRNLEGLPRLLLTAALIAILTCGLVVVTQSLFAAASPTANPSITDTNTSNTTYPSSGGQGNPSSTDTSFDKPAANSNNTSDKPVDSIPFMDALHPVENIEIAMINTSFSNLRGGYGFISSSNVTDYITAPIDTALGGNTTLWDAAFKIQRDYITPIGDSILAFFVLLQLIKISQRIDSTATLPAVKEIFFLFVQIAVLQWCIGHSVEIMRDVYTIFMSLAKNIPAATDQGTLNAYKSMTVTEFPDHVDFGGCFLLMIVSFLFWLSFFVAYVVEVGTVFARILQLLILSMFAPIPFSLLGFQETRQMGVGYIRSFAAASLAGAIMLMIIWFFPYVLAAVFGMYGTSGGSDGILAIATGMSSSWPMVFGGLVACAFVYIKALMDSGNWANAVFGM